MTSVCFSPNRVTTCPAAVEPATTTAVGTDQHGEREHRQYRDLAVPRRADLAAVVVRRPQMNQSLASPLADTGFSVGPDAKQLPVLGGGRRVDGTHDGACAVPASACGHRLLMRAFGMPGRRRG